MKQLFFYELFRLVSKFKINKINEVPYSYNLVPFIQNKVDISVAYIMDQVITLQNEGIELNIITCKENGINPYGDVIITTEQTLKEKPDLVERFIAATVECHNWAINNPIEAVNELVESTKILISENEIKVWEATIPFIIADGNQDEIIRMSEDKWINTMNILKEFEFLKSSFLLDEAFINLN